MQAELNIARGYVTIAPMNFLTIGNVTKDLAANGYNVGGTVTYASVTALQLGYKPAVLTRMGSDVILPEVYGDIELYPLPSPHTLTFENVYTPTGRVQTIHAFGGPITLRDVPRRLTDKPPAIVLLGPLSGELDPQVAQHFPGALLGAVPQGWMRRWDAQGRVSHSPLACDAELLRYVEVLVVSTEDINHDENLARCYAESVKTVVLTRNSDGADVYHAGQVTRVAPRPALQVDPTGAGDIFAAAFLVYLHESGNPIKAARFANVTASFGVEGTSYTSIPTRRQVDAYLAEYGW